MHVNILIYKEYLLLALEYVIVDFVFLLYITQIVIDNFCFMRLLNSCFYNVFSRLILYVFFCVFAVKRGSVTCHVYLLQAREREVKERLCASEC